MTLTSLYRRLLLVAFLCIPTWALAEAGPEPAARPAQGIERHLAADLQTEIAHIQPLLDRYGYHAVALSVGIEGAGVPAPGQTMLIAGAVEAATRPRLHIGWLLAIAFLAAVVGNSLGYLIGRRGGRPLLQRLRLDEARQQRIEDTFARWGGGFVVGARFFDGLRQLNGIAAGVLEMPWWRFTVFNMIGAALWVGAWGLGAYYVDEHLGAILTLIHRLNPWVAAATLAGLAALAVALLVAYRRARRAEQ